jgi:hypothetical protein
MLVASLADRVGIAVSDARYVAFTGGGEAAAAVMGGQVTAAVSGFGEWKAHARSGRMRLLAISAPTRPSAEAPPTFRELGLDLVVTNFRCLVSPPGIGEEARAWILEALRRMRATYEWQTWLARNDWEDSFLEGEEFQRFLRAEVVSTAARLRELNLGREGRGYAVVGPWAMPTLVAIGLVLCVCWMLAPIVRGAPRRRLSWPSDRTAWRPLTATLLLLAAYAATFESVGFPASTALYLFLQARILGSRAGPRDAIVAISVTMATYLVFTRLLNVSLPLGFLDS